MFRALLALCFTISTLFGQVMCCCAIASSCETQSEQIPAKRTCCSTDHSDKLPAAPTKQQKHDHCPCNKDKQTLLAVPSEEVQLTASTAWFASSLGEFGTMFEPFIALGNVQPILAGQCQLQSSFHLSTADLLYAHHRLRC
jgi:hypothetical protein